jgi:hypothetical protein
MPDLMHTLQGHDLGFLKIVAEAWGLDLQAPDVHAALPLLVGGMSNRLLAEEIIDSLPAPARQALRELLKNEGLLSWALFCRRFGEVRQMGAGKRDRQRPDLQPASPAEMLWYRGLVGKAFLNLPPEPQEYAYIPDELLFFVEPLSAETQCPPGRPATPAESSHSRPVNLRILEDTCTLLAALRSQIDLRTLDADLLAIPASVLVSLCQAAGLVDEQRRPHPEQVRQFLEASQEEALTRLVRAWRGSAAFNDLRLLPGLVFEGEWHNDPLQTRTAVLDMLSQLPPQTWWNISAFIQAIHENQPDFQRPAGDYDSWFIRRENSQTYLRGFSAWQDVEGTLLRFIITGPLHWLGMLELAAPSPGAEDAAFRSSAWATTLWQDHPIQHLPSESGKIKISSDGKIRVAARAPRAERYQISRFCDWHGRQQDTYLYQATPSSLRRAASQDLRPSHLLAFLGRIPDLPLPPSFSKALDRWEKQGTQARLQPATLLRVDSPEILEALRNSTAGRYLDEELNPTSVLVKEGKLDKVRSALAELGYLSD